VVEEETRRCLEEVESLVACRRRPEEMESPEVSRQRREERGSTWLCVVQVPNVKLSAMARSHN
jgi:hypothetical protein